MPVMTQTNGMIVRTWSATADAAGAGSYTRYFDGILLPELRKLPGFNGACLLRRDLGEDGTVELTTHTFWESPEAIGAFAGDDITVSVVEPEAQAMLLDFDHSATHRTVVVDVRD
jgi:heme-degrading monooxygenase HmoA